MRRANVLADPAGGPRDFLTTGFRDRRWPTKSLVGQESGPARRVNPRGRASNGIGEEMNTAHFERGDIIFREDEESRYVLQIITGTVEVTKLVDDHRIVLGQVSGSRWRVRA